MTQMKKVLTTGEVAKICGVAPRTVSKWFDSGHLRGYRIPGSKDRRIPMEQLIRFMRANGMPLGEVDTGRLKVLIVDADFSLAEALAQALRDRHDYDAFTATSVMEAGAVAACEKPDVVVIDASLPDVVPALIVQWIRSTEELRDTCLIATGTMLSKSKGQGLVQQGFDAFVAKPFDVRTLIEMLEACLSVAPH
ncbi:MAG: response regulator [Phycisphaerae bacterium]